MMKWTRINSVNAYYSVGNVLSSHLLSRMLKIKVHTTMILSFVLYEYEIWENKLHQSA